MLILFPFELIQMELGWGLCDEIQEQQGIADSLRKECW